MKTLPHWMACASFPVLLALHAAGSAAFTDTNAEMKEAAADRAMAVVAARPVPRPVRTAWVPPSPKALDGFRPVFPDDGAASAAARRRAVALAG